MGKNWEGDELLKFYTFIIYNFGFIVRKKTKNTDLSKFLDSEQDHSVILKRNNLSLKFVKVGSSAEYSTAY